MSKIDDLAKLIVDIIEKKDSKKPRALDTVGTVTRVDGDYAWIRLAGSEEETPVKETITVKKGDKVQVRASKGSAWIVGNETAPPTDDTLAKKALENSDKAGKAAKRASDMTIVNDTLYYLASDHDEGVTVEDEGWTKEPQEVTESLPYLWAYHDYERGNGTHFKSDPVIIAMYAEDGVGVVSVETYYYVSTSQYQLIGGSWGTTYNYVSGTYIWRKELITHDDGTTTWTTALYDSGLTKSLELAYDTAQYIWTESTGSTDVPTGQYVTEVTKARYKSNPTGGALLLRSAGLYLRYAAKTIVELLGSGLKIYEQNDDTNPVAQFLSSGTIIGKENDYNVRITSGSLQARYTDAVRGELNFGSGQTVYLKRPGAYGTALTLDDYNFSLRYYNSSHNDAYVMSQDSANIFGIIIGPKLEVLGDVDVSTGKIMAGAINSNLFSVSSVSVSTDSGTGNLTGTATATKTGYYPLAIAGLSVVTGGCYSRGAYLTSQASGSCTVNFRAYNNSGKSQAVNATAYVLWVKTTA